MPTRWQHTDSGREKLSTYAKVRWAEMTPEQKQQWRDQMVLGKKRAEKNRKSHEWRKRNGVIKGVRRTKYTPTLDRFSKRTADMQVQHTHTQPPPAPPVLTLTCTVPLDQMATVMQFLLTHTCTIVEVTR